jgi:hypothetical protein
MLNDITTNHKSDKPIDSFDQHYDQSKIKNPNTSKGHVDKSSNKLFETNDTKNTKANMAFTNGELSALDDDGNLHNNIGKSDGVSDNYDAKKKITKAGRVKSMDNLIGNAMNRIKTKVTDIGKSPTKRKVTKDHPTPIEQTPRLGATSWQDA